MELTTNSSDKEMSQQSCRYNRATCKKPHWGSRGPYAWLHPPSKGEYGESDLESCMVNWSQHTPENRLRHGCISWRTQWTSSALPKERPTTRIPRLMRDKGNLQMKDDMVGFAPRRISLANNQLKMMEGFLVEHSVWWPFNPRSDRATGDLLCLIFYFYFYFFIL